MASPSLCIEELWICPPLAFARFGQTEEPMVNFHWAPNDYKSRGTGETVIQPTTTFNVGPDGMISAYLPTAIQFRDGANWRPVCPFFELHGRTSDGVSGPMTPERLGACGAGLSDVTWHIHTANRKAYHYTLSEGDQADAKVEIPGDCHDKTPLDGVSPEGAANPLILGDPVPLGAVQVICPTNDWPELRLRVTPPKGHIYAPTNTASRNLRALLPANQLTEDFLKEIGTILNPASPWAKWKPVNDDPRTNPGGLYAQEPDGTSLGFFDDSSDGLIAVTIKGQDIAPAYARFTCCPQDFQPDRRPFRSVSDGLTDLVAREAVSEPEFVEGARWIETEMEIADFMQRVRETMEASNLDHQNLRSLLANDGITSVNPDYPFKPEPPRPGHPLPLTEIGRANHARFLAYDVFRQRMARRPDLLERWIRNPAGEPTVYDRQMPAVMRGSDSYPMTITQRQYNLMRSWLNVVSHQDTSK